LQNQIDIYKREIHHVFMKVVHAEMRNGVIYPKEKLDIDDKDVLIRIEAVHEIRREAREDIIEAMAELDIEEMT
jgi:predicted DNA-binding antitoxin AbrB/MazE fold protein